ncbi:hypothetical protein DPMN_124222 [Dreissena polymorpha]|uniref:COX assembly mitochondrial protein n=1 Tax=Dreissena polymorpha TaxID=45954 RepID=A0A9D4GSB0_DREPO|nr:hypothetical protein DPMN_124222 [Dreissena polymorpha]
MAHPNLSPHLHTEECNGYIKEYQDCHADLWKKFSGQCNPEYLAMMKCFRREKDYKRKNHKLRVKIYVEKPSQPEDHTADD